MQPAFAALLTLFALAAGACASAHERDRPLTPAERARAIEAVNAREGIQTPPPGPMGPCGNSTSLTRLQARQERFSGPNSFGMLPCGAGNDVR